MSRPLKNLFPFFFFKLLSVFFFFLTDYCKCTTTRYTLKLVSSDVQATEESISDSSHSLCVYLQVVELCTESTHLYKTDHNHLHTKLTSSPIPVYYKLHRQKKAALK